jgi:ligand-binding sensor domain-containing protein
MMFILMVSAISSISVAQVPFSEGFTAKSFYSVIVDDNDTKWFLTESGIASFDGKIWILQNKNSKIPSKDVKSFSYDGVDGNKIWLATPQGAVVTSLPMSAESVTSTFSPANSPIASANVVSVATGKSPLRWIGTDKGVWAYYENKWLTNTYEKKYPSDLFKEFPITSMAADATGDTVFVATDGFGVARLYRDKVDGVSGASEYAQWGPIEIPSDKVYSICLAPDGTQWFGTDLGVGKHTGYNTLENWTIFTTENGLVNNFVQAIAYDKKGNLWFGTKGGVSLFDGTAWTSFTENEGLSSDNILSIAEDKAGTIWLGTDNGVTSLTNGKLTSYK